MNTTVLDNLERFIHAYGRYVPIGDPKELRVALATHDILGQDLPRDSFLYCLAETALNQVLDSRGIGRIEMNRVTDDVDAQLVRQNRMIVENIRKKLDQLLMC